MKVLSFDGPPSPSVAGENGQRGVDRVNGVLYVRCAAGWANHGACDPTLGLPPPEPESASESEPESASGAPFDEELPPTDPEVDLGKFDYSDKVLNAVANKFGVDAQELLLFAARTADKDGNKYLKKPELVAAAKELVS
jgi:hypothetical protein